MDGKIGFASLHGRFELLHEKPLAPHLRQALPQRSVEVRQGSFRLGGLIVDCPEKNLRADQTFDGKLKDLDGHFAELFGLSLPDSGA